MKTRRTPIVGGAIAIAAPVAAMIAAVITAGMTPSAAAGDIDPTDLVPSQAIVKLKADEDITDIDRDYDTEAVAALPGLDLYLLTLPTHWDEDDFRDLLEDDSRVDKAFLNYSSDLAGGETQGFFYDVVPGDFGGQPAWTVVDLPGAQGVTRGAGVTVAVIDTGFDPAHPALAGLDIQPGYDFVDRDAEPLDVGNGRDDDGDGEVDELVGHGTFVLGLVAAIAPEATLLPIRALNGDGRGQGFHLAEAIYYAVEHGADVINISLATPRETDIVKDAVDYARDQNVTIVAAAGNTGRKDPKHFPSASDKVISVAATDSVDIKGPFSNWGKHVDVSAPGIDLVSTMPGDRYARSSGTSLSTALVTGAAALIKSRDPEMKPSDVEKALEENAVDVDDLNPDYKDHMGKGRLDMLAALAIERADGDDADLNEDGTVDTADLVILLGAWGPCPADDACPADLDESDAVDTVDLIMLLGKWD